MHQVSVFDIYNRFFVKRKQSISVRDIVSIISCECSHEQYPVGILGFMPLESASSGDLTFFDSNPVSGNKYVSYLKKTKASYCLVKREHLHLVPSDVIPIVTHNPHKDFLILCDFFVLEKQIDEDAQNDISSSAKISQHVSIGKGVHISDGVIIHDFAKIGDGVKIGRNTIIKSGVSIGNNCTIGSNCKIFENTVLKFTEVGEGTIIHANASIGHNGFGFVMDREHGNHFMLTHYGCVKIGNNVRIGANTCIDRGSFGDTEVCDNVKLDNLIQVAHNVKIGNGTIIAGHTAIAGSTKIGHMCVIGGCVCIVGHISIGDHTIIYGGAAVTKSFPSHSKLMSGWPAERHTEWIKKILIINKIIKIIGKLYSPDPKASLKKRIIHAIVSKLIGVRKRESKKKQLD